MVWIMRKIYWLLITITVVSQHTNYIFSNLRENIFFWLHVLLALIIYRFYAVK